MELLTIAQKESIKLEAGDDKWVDIVRVGDWSKSYKNFKLTAKELNQMVENFDNNVLRHDSKELQFNYSHQSYDKAAGWITALRVEKKKLQAQVRWTPAGKQSIEDEEMKYVSAELDLHYEDYETGEEFGTTLTGAALTNIPFVRGMKAVALSDDKQSEIILSNNNQKMELFKQMLSTLQAQETLSLAEVNVMKQTVAMLSDEEQAEVKQDVADLEEKATADEAKAKEASDAKEAELADAKAKIEASTAKGDDNAKMVELSTKLAENQKQLDQMKSETRKRDLTDSVKALSAEGKLPVAKQDATVALLMDISEDKAAKWLEYLSDMPKSIDLSKEVGDSGAQGSTDLDNVTDAQIQKLAKDLMESEGLDHSAAVSKALNQLSTNN